jgi:hypothetical protein
MKPDLKCCFSKHTKCSTGNVSELEEHRLTRVAIERKYKEVTILFWNRMT